jgi:ribosome recycling factor
MEEIEMFLDEAKSLMAKAVEHTQSELHKIRAGKATPSMLDGIHVEYYGVDTPLNQVASINTPDARSIMIKAWEKSLVSEIERAIINSDLGLTPQNDGENIRINIPALTEDRRLQLVKQVKSECEHGKISIRTIRKETNDSIKKLQNEGASEDAVKEGELEVQKLTDNFSNRMDEIFKHKEQEIMTV